MACILKFALIRAIRGQNFLRFFDDVFFQRADRA